jgi:hypothetical protein
MTDEEVKRVLAGLQYEHDDRAAPDGLRRGQFTAGWEDATVRNELYLDATLRHLTWHNLGYRCGRQLGARSTAQIEIAYERLAEQYVGPQTSDAISLPGEIADEAALVEGAAFRVLTTVYERNRTARERCIAKYGANCCICGFNFGCVYGQVAEGFVHVHHLRSLAEIGEEYVIDPEEDLRPVCPNCHAVLHLRTPAYSIEEVTAFLGAERHGSG